MAVYVVETPQQGGRVVRFYVLSEDLADTAEQMARARKAEENGGAEEEAGAAAHVAGGDDEAAGSSGKDVPGAQGISSGDTARVGDASTADISEDAADRSEAIAVGGGKDSEQSSND